MYGHLSLSPLNVLVKLTPTVQPRPLGTLRDTIVISTGDVSEWQGAAACRTSTWLAKRLLNHDAEKLSYAAFQLAFAVPMVLLTLASFAAKSSIPQLVSWPCHILFAIDCFVYRPRRRNAREKEVDKLAMSMMAKAGYDPADLLGFYKACLTRCTKTREQAAKSHPTAFKWLDGPIYRPAMGRVSEIGAMSEYG